MADAGQSRGKHETELLRMNIKDQLNRLLTQLEDLDELKEEFAAEEWAEMRAETLEQLKEFEAFMERAMGGDMTLVDEFGGAQLAIQAAISDAFKTPEVIRMFAQKQPDQLRKRLAGLRRELDLKHISEPQFNRQAVEVLVALKKLGTALKPDEQAFLDTMSTARQLESAVNSLGSGAQRNLMSEASSQIKSAEN